MTKTAQSVTRFKPGDEVYVRLPESHRGAWSEYAKCPEEFIALKPPSLSFESAAAIPLAATTAFQALQKYNGDLAGKTVFVPAGRTIPFFVSNRHAYLTTMQLVGLVYMHVN